jgi:hypothetical protein
METRAYVDRKKIEMKATHKVEQKEKKNWSNVTGRKNNQTESDDRSKPL